VIYLPLTSSLIDTPRDKSTGILGSMRPLKLGSLRYLAQRWDSPQALTLGMPYPSCIAEAVRPCGYADLYPCSKAKLRVASPLLPKGEASAKGDATAVQVLFSLKQIAPKI
jgi:hypothetical protein